MIKSVSLSLSPSEAYSENAVKQKVREELGLGASDVFYVELERRSIDSRQRNIKVNLTLKVFINEPPQEENIQFDYKDVSLAQPVYIVGAGPAGLFAALRCLEQGYKPVIFERGKDVQSRRRDLATLNRDHVVNPESNYCFGEGGAGTYSDGKLYTRSHKRGDVLKTLRTLVFHGAERTILADAHPHVGTNKLPKIITGIRETIVKCGGELLFNTRLTDIVIEKGSVKAVQIIFDGKEQEISCNNLILATGHSAEDIYHLLDRKKYCWKPSLLPWV